MYKTNLTVQDIYQIKQAEELNSRYLQLQKTVSDYDKTAVDVGHYIGIKEEAEAQIEANKNRPWWHLSKYLENADWKLGANVSSNQIARLNENLTKDETKYNKAKADLRTLDTLKTKFVGPVSEEQDENTREEKFSTFLTKSSRVIELDNQRDKHVREDIAANNQIRDYIECAKGTREFINGYISDSSIFAKDVAIMKNDEQHQKLEKSSTLKRDYYRAKAENQTAKTFIGRRLFNYYVAQNHKYENMRKENFEYRQEHTGEFEIATAHMTALNAWGISTKNENLVNEMIKEQKQVKIEHTQVTERIRGRHVTHTEPIFKPSAVMERNKGIINEATEKLSQKIEADEPIILNTIQATALTRATAEEHVKEEVIKLNQELENANNNVQPNIQLPVAPSQNQANTFAPVLFVPALDIPDGQFNQQPNAQQPNTDENGPSNEPVVFVQHFNWK